MFDRVGDLAEKVATKVSRRAFLGRLGQGALGLAAVIGGALAFPADARAAAKSCWFCAIPFVGSFYACSVQPPYPNYCYFTRSGCDGCH